LPRPTDGQLASRRIPVHGRSGADESAGTDLDRRHQTTVGPDEGFIADDRPVLVDPVIVAGNGARTNVDAVTDGRIAHVAEMIDLAAFAHLGLLDFDKVPDPRASRQPRTGTQARERAHDALLAHLRTVQHAVRLHPRATGKGAVADYTVGTDGDVVPEPHVALEHHVDIDRAIAAGA